MPANTLPLNTTLNVSVNTASAAAIQAPNLNVKFLGNVYTFNVSPAATAPFSPPVTLIFPYPCNSVDPKTIQVMFTENNGANWATSGMSVLGISNCAVTVTTTHFSTWSLFTENYLSSNSAGGANILAPVPANSGDNICLYTNQAIASSTWFIYSVAGYHVASLSFTNQAAQCWNTAGVGRGLYYVKLVMTFADGTSGTEWHKVVVR